MGALLLNILSKYSEGWMTSLAFDYWGIGAKFMYLLSFLITDPIDDVLILLNSLFFDD